jgi:hypothetical protein
MQKVQEEGLLPMEERSPSHELFQRDFFIRGMPRYLDGSELHMKPRRLVM